MRSNKKSFYNTHALPFIVVGVGSILCFYDFFLRVIPGVLSNEVMGYLQINVISFSILSSSFYFGYIPMQIPAGILCDKIGPKKLLTISVLLCALSTIVFSSSRNFTISCGSRLVMGIVSSSAYVCAFTLARAWFNKKYFAFIVGVIQVIGCVGAIVGGVPITLLAKVYPWNDVVFYTGIIGIILTLVFIVFIKDSPHDNNDVTKFSKEKTPIIDDLCLVIFNKQNLYTALAALCSWAPIAIFSELWGVPFLMSLQKVSSTVAAQEASFVWYGIAIASPLAGLLSNKIKSRKIPIMICAFTGFIASILLLYCNITSEVAVDIILFFIGSSASSQAVALGLVSDNNSEKTLGTAVGFNDMVVIFSALLQVPVGMLLSHYWSGKIVSGVPHYGYYEFSHALLVIPCIYTIGFFITLFLIKETRCQQSF